MRKASARGRLGTGNTEATMAFVPPDRHPLRAKDLVDARYFEPLAVQDMARAGRPVAGPLQP
jgi:hypothetical protein